MIPLFDYESHGLIMESYFSFEGYDFLYFTSPVDFYTLYRSTRKINTFNELEYFAEVLIHLNPKLEKGLFIRLMLELADRVNGHVIRTYSEERILEMCDNVFFNRKVPFCRRKRKILFNPSKIIPIEDKRMIIGKVLSKGVNNLEAIYNMVEEYMEEGQIIYISEIAKKLNMSHRTVQRAIDKHLKSVIDFHNNMLKYQNFYEIIDAFDLLTENKTVQEKINALNVIRKLNNRDFKNLFENYLEN